MTYYILAQLIYEQILLLPTIFLLLDYIFSFVIFNISIWKQYFCVFVVSYKACKDILYVVSRYQFYFD